MALHQAIRSTMKCLFKKKKKRRKKTKIHLLTFCCGDFNAPSARQKKIDPQMSRTDATTEPPLCTRSSATCQRPAPGRGAANPLRGSGIVCRNLLVRHTPKTSKQVRSEASHHGWLSPSRCGATSPGSCLIYGAGAPDIRRPVSAALFPGLFNENKSPAQPCYPLFWGVISADGQL